MSNFYTCRIRLTQGDVQLKHALQCSLLVKDSFHPFLKKMFDIIGIDQSNHLVNKKNQTIFYVLSRAIFLYTCHEIVYLCQSFSDIIVGK